MYFYFYQLELQSLQPVSIGYNVQKQQFKIGTQQSKVIKMGAESSYSIPQTLSERTSQVFLKIYEPINETFDESLGKVKIFRKKQYNYDYVGIVDKIIQKQYMNELRNILKIGQRTSSETKQKQKQSKHQVINPIDTTHLWVKVFACEIYPIENDDNKYCHAKICLQYFNYTVKDYLNNQVQGLQTDKISYILSSILSCYQSIVSLVHRYSYINSIPLINSITTPSLIYIDIEGCLKFLSIPIFMLTDYVTNVDKCMINCCQFDGDGNYQYRNIVIPKFGRTSDRNGYEQGLKFVQEDKMDKLFINRFKKMIKYMKNITPTTESSIKNSQHHEAKTQSNSYIHLQMPSQKYQSGSVHRKQEQFWAELQSFNTVEEFTRYLHNMPDKLESLEFDKTPEIKNRHPAIPKQPTAKVQKYTLRNYQSNNQTLDSTYTPKPPNPLTTQPKQPRPQSQPQIRSNSVRYSIGPKTHSTVYQKSYHYL